MNGGVLQYFDVVQLLRFTFYDFHVRFCSFSNQTVSFYFSIFTAISFSVDS